MLQVGHMKAQTSKKDEQIEVQERQIKIHQQQNESLQEQKTDVSKVTEGWQTKICKSVVIGTAPWCSTSKADCTSDTYGVPEEVKAVGSGCAVGWKQNCTYCQPAGIIWKNINGAPLPNMPMPARDSWDCNLQCYANSQCLGWTFSLSQYIHKDPRGYPHSRACWLRSSWGGVAEGCDTCVSGSPCGLYAGNNFGAVLAAVASTDACNCQSLCAKRFPACRAWTFSAKDFVSGNINCWLRKEYGFRIDNCETCTSGKVCGSAGNNMGAALPDMPVATTYSCECEAACNAHPGCKAWTYSSNDFVVPLDNYRLSGTSYRRPKGSRNCWLRSSDGGRVDNCPSCISGVKR